MSNTFKTEAIVLRKLRYGEADSILHLYTREQGRVGAIAKGVRRSRSRFGGRLEPFFRLELVLHEGRGELATVTSAGTLDGYPRLRERARSIDAAAKTGDFVLRLLDGRERNDPAYNLLVNMLALLDRDAAAARREVSLAFRAKMLLAAGFSPELGNCVQCGTSEDLVAFSPASGGVVCRDCRAAGDFDFAPASYEFMSRAIGAPLEQAPPAAPEALRQTDRAITETLAYHAHVRVRSLA
ncbi:MAG: DNA repair protein RecO [Thermoleophilia bacterium]|nr:DNA repair protein RecO [Thermoleophilia bacterium]